MMKNEGIEDEMHNTYREKKEGRQVLVAGRWQGFLIQRDGKRREERESLALAEPFIVVPGPRTT